jgi:hypothetical protein
VPRPAINLAAFGAITATNAVGIARLLEDVAITAYTGSIAGLTTSNATYAAQILGAESFHSGALRLISIQNPTITDLSTADSLDIAPNDPGSAQNASSGIVGFFPTYSGATAVTNTITGYAITRTTSQVLAVLYGSGTALAASGKTSGGFFPSGVNGNINTV